MNRIVCDFSNVYESTKTLEKYADQMQVDLENYKQNAEQLLTWQGKASVSFKQSLESQCDEIRKNINHIKGLTLFLRRCAEMFENTENNFSNRR